MKTFKKRAKGVDNYVMNTLKKIDYYSYLRFITEQGLIERDFVFLRWKNKTMQKNELKELKCGVMAKTHNLFKKEQPSRVDDEVTQEKLQGIYCGINHQDFDDDAISFDYDYSNRYNKEWY